MIGISILMSKISYNKILLEKRDNLESLQDDFNQLEPKELLIFFEKVLGYVPPKMQSIAIQEEEKVKLGSLNLSIKDELLPLVRIQSKSESS
jgi:hypothetical protein